MAVYRAGDAGTSIVFAWLTDGIGLGVAAMAAIGAGIAAVWAAMGVYLGRVFNRAGEASKPGTAGNDSLVGSEEAAR